MKKPLQKLFQFLYGPIFLVIDFFIRNYRANRERLQKLMSREKVASFFQNAAVILLIVWILVFSLASEQQRSKISEALKGGFSGLITFTDN